MTASKIASKYRYLAKKQVREELGKFGFEEK
jgi:hypothetical protein